MGFRALGFKSLGAWGLELRHLGGFSFIGL